MARPCGCAGECGCTIVGIDGIRTSGAGTVRDPILVGLNNPLGGNGCEAVMDCVGGSLGNGLTYNDTLNQISTRISGDGGNSIVYGSDGGLYSTGGGGGGGEGIPTVASLPATNIVGAQYGAGFSQFPEGPIAAYEAAADMDEIQLIHVPVRRLTDFYLAAAHYRALGTYDPNLNAENTLTMDLKQWKRVNYKPSGAPLGGGGYDPLAGYFGSSYPDTGIQGRGGTLITDVIRATGRRRVLYFQVKDIGSSVGDTPAPQQTGFVLGQLIQQWGMQKSCIVGSEIPFTASAPDIANIVAGLQQFQPITDTAAHIISQAQANALTPAYLTSIGVKWVMITYSVADSSPATVEAYRDAGLQVMLFGGHRQWHYEKQRTLGLRGILCADPAYAGGWRTQFRYRESSATWGWGTPDYGRHAYSTAAMAHTSERGYVENGQGGKLCIRQDLVPPTDTAADIQSGYYVLAGEQCPIHDPTRDPNAVGDYGSPTNYDIEVGFSWSRLISDRSRWMSVFFGSPEDRSVTDYTRATQYTRGYQLQLTQSGQFILQRYDGIPWTGPIPPNGPPWQYNRVWASGWGAINANQEYRIVIQVRGAQFTCGRLGPGNTVLNGETFLDTEASGYGGRWRGPYFYLGRHFWNTSDGAICRFHTLTTRTY